MTHPMPLNEPPPIPLPEYTTLGPSLSFGHALDVLKAGGLVTRSGWNGNRIAHPGAPLTVFMWLLLIPGSTFRVDPNRPMGRHLPANMEVNYLPHIDMRTVRGEFVPWLASQTDVLAEDWVQVVRIVQSNQPQPETQA